MTCTLLSPPAACDRAESGFWTRPLGTWNDGNDNQGLLELPKYMYCPPGSFATSFYMRPSQWYTGDFSGSTWIGSLTMTCSDGSTVTLESQAGFYPGWPDGTTTSPAGKLSTPPLHSAHSGSRLTEPG
jgi:hypothetical protein